MKRPRLQLTALQAALLLSNLVLLGVIAAMLGWRWPLPVIPQKAGVAPRGLALHNAADAAAPDAATLYTQLLAHPVFHRSRRYIAPSTSTPASPPTPPPAYRIAGYFSFGSRPGKAFLRATDTSKTVSVAVGDTLDGWTVISVSPHQVALRQGERESALGAGSSTGNRGTEAAVSSANGASTATQTPGLTSTGSLSAATSNAIHAASLPATHGSGAPGSRLPLEERPATAPPRRPRALYRPPAPPSPANSTAHQP